MSTINLEMFTFFQAKVRLFRHIGSTTEIRMDPSEIDAVMKFNVPENQKDVQSYIGFLNFYRK